MRKRTRRKWKVYAADVAVLFLASQLVTVLHSNTEIMAEPPETPIQYVEAAGYEKRPEWNETEACEKAVRIEETELETEPKKSDFCLEDIKVLLKIAMAEAEGEGVEGKAYVMRVVLNRVLSEEFPETIKDVVFQKGQFTPVEDGGRYWTVEPDEECYKAYEMILNGWDKSKGALYFCTDGASKWIEDNTEYLYTVGNHNFFK